MTKIVKKQRVYKGLTIMEMVIALAMIAVIFAAILPQFRNVLNSWDSRQANAETVQNERVLINYLNMNLSKAVKVTAVSDSSVVLGFIEFEDANADTYRCDVAASKYVQYGQVGSQVELAGPVSKLQFTCYALDDLDTPITTVDDIRFVKIEATILSPGSMGQDRTVTASAYLQTNSSGSGGGLTASAVNPFSLPALIVLGLCKIDDTHYVWSDGYEDDYVLYADKDTGVVSLLTNYNHGGDRRLYPTYIQIDATHILKASCRGIFPGYACVFTINPDWTITEEPGHEFDGSKGHWPALAKIDDTHYLCVYQGPQLDGWACVLTINPADWSITSGSNYEWDTINAAYPTVHKIDDGHYLVSFRGGGGASTKAFVLNVDTVTYALSKNPYVVSFPSTTLSRSDICQIDPTHYLVQYCPTGSPRTYVVLLTVNTSAWTVSTRPPFEVAPMGQADAVLGKFDSPDYVCMYSDESSKIYAVDITVNTSDWSISMGSPVTIALSDRTSEDPVMVTIDDENVLCIYTGNSDSYGVIFTSESPLMP